MQKMMWQEVFDTQTGKLDANAAVKGGRYPFFTCAKEISTIDEYAYDCEALLLAGNNAVGDYDVKYYKGKFNAYQRTYILMLKNRQYSYSVFKFQLEQKLRYLQLQSKGTNTRYLTMGILKSLDFIVPPIVKQQEFAQFVNATDKSRFLERFGDPIINPFGYPIHKLGDYIENLTSGARGWARYYADDGNAWFITIKNVKNCKITVDNMQTINAPDNAEAKRTRVKEGDLLISITADLGRTGVVTKEIANKGSYINQHLSCIRLNRYALEPLYVAYFMESEAGKRQFKKENQSAVKAGINFKSIQSLKLMVPPLVRQEEFLSFYKQVDKSKYREAIFLYLLEDIRICCNI